MPLEKSEQERAKKALDAYKKVMEGAPKIKAEHKVKEGETLSHIALKHYGSAVKAKWMVIYEANKDVIGDNPNIIVPGQVLKIPEL
jgi:nucleoid-associated protein YgaU